jgi:hypothetical protein
MQSAIVVTIPSPSSSSSSSIINFPRQSQHNKMLCAKMNMQPCVGY